MDKKHTTCPVCKEACSLIDVVDFNKSCEEARGNFLEISGLPIYYALCGACGFCFSPDIYLWSLADFEERIYNNSYILVDPDYQEIRPQSNARSLISMFGSLPSSIRHLDYGGGNGLLVEVLKKSGWNSASYDPFVDRNVDIAQLGKFDLITSFEVFEHVPNVQELMDNICKLLAPNGVLLFSTLISDGNIFKNQRITWWYASPRNGHISLFSKQSLAILAHNKGLRFGSFSEGFHTFFTEVPSWASHLIRVA